MTDELNSTVQALITLCPINSERIDRQIVSQDIYEILITILKFVPDVRDAYPGIQEEFYEARFIEYLGAYGNGEFNNLYNAIIPINYEMIANLFDDQLDGLSAEDISGRASLFDVVKDNIFNTVMTQVMSEFRLYHNRNRSVME